jgi:HSP20 family protein
MLDSLRRIGRDVGRGLNRAVESLAEGWRELLTRSGSTLTRFRRDRDEVASAGFPVWSLLGAEAFESDREIVVRLEVPGLEPKDCDIAVEGNTLYVRGEKRHEREVNDARYYLAECAYGYFERALPLPDNVDADRARASYRNGVLTVRLPKIRPARRIPVH